MTARISLTENGRSTQVHLVRDASGSWSEVPGEPPIPKPSYIELSLVQDLNVPPRIEGVDPRTKRKRTLLEPNQLFREWDLGSAALFTWKDRADRSYTGALLLPPQYQRGTRYPVVIQLGGLRKDEFIVDGPAGRSSAYAARSLTARGIVVMQAPNLASPIRARTNDRDEIRDIVDGIEGAIDALDREGIIDRARVGLIGFSRTGMHAHIMAAYSNYQLAAITVADSFAMTPFCYAGAAGVGFPGMLHLEEPYNMGAPFWGAGIEKWMARSYLFNLDRIRTPIRYEHYGVRPSCHGEIIGILQRFKRPVEVVHLPNAVHNLQAPWHRQTSQEGNVDWYDFWLNGQENPALEKADQYARWRELRRQRDAVLEEPGQPALSLEGGHKPLGKERMPPQRPAPTSPAKTFR
jgi:hypothetical protein